MSLHFYTFQVHFFRPPLFGLIYWFRAKTTWGTYPTGFLSSKKWILGLSEIFSEKSWIFSEKRKFLFYLYFLSPNLVKLFPDKIYYDFYHTSPFKQVKRPDLAFFEHFGHFWWPLLRTKFRGLNASETQFSCLHMKIGCWENVWVPSVHRKKSSSYPLKIASKIFGFSTKEFLGIFCSHLAISLNKHPPKWNFGHNGTVGGV